MSLLLLSALAGLSSAVLTGGSGGRPLPLGCVADNLLDTLRTPGQRHEARNFCRGYLDVQPSVEVTYVSTVTPVETVLSTETVTTVIVESSTVVDVSTAVITSTETTIFSTSVQTFQDLELRAPGTMTMGFSDMLVALHQPSALSSACKCIPLNKCGGAKAGTTTSTATATAPESTEVLVSTLTVESVSTDITTTVTTTTTDTTVTNSVVTTTTTTEDAPGPTISAFRIIVNDESNIGTNKRDTNNKQYLAAVGSNGGYEYVYAQGYESMAASFHIDEAGHLVLEGGQIGQKSYAWFGTTFESPVNLLQFQQENWIAARTGGEAVMNEVEVGEDDEILVTKGFQGYGVPMTPGINLFQVCDMTVQTISNRPFLLVGPTLRPGCRPAKIHTEELSVRD
ncbi:hypothetical protein OQA88_12866 [Cercophora sp. LCS_1]